MMSGHASRTFKDFCRQLDPSLAKRNENMSNMRVAPPRLFALLSPVVLDCR